MGERQGRGRPVDRARDAQYELAHAELGRAADVAQALGVTTQAVYDWRRRRGFVAPPTRRAPSDLRTLMLALLGLGPSSVAGLAMELSVERRRAKAELTRLRAAGLVERVGVGAYVLVPARTLSVPDPR